MSIIKCQPAIPSTVFNREQTLNCGIQIHYIGKVRQGGDLNVLFVSNSENQTKSSNKDFFLSFFVCYSYKKSSNCSSTMRKHMSTVGLSQLGQSVLPVAHILFHILSSIAFIHALHHYTTSTNSFAINAQFDE
jgi:hypothetical protein